MNNKTIISPCITVCKTDPITGLCYGCGRSSEDKIMWKNAETNTSAHSGTKNRKHLPSCELFLGIPLVISSYFEIQ